MWKHLGLTQCGQGLGQRSSPRPLQGAVLWATVQLAVPVAPTGLRPQGPHLWGGIWGQIPSSRLGMVSIHTAHRVAAGHVGA